jgi:hypothetical protein
MIYPAIFDARAFCDSMAKILKEVSWRTSGEGQPAKPDLITYHTRRAGYTAEKFEKSDEGMTKLGNEIADLAQRITSLVGNANLGERTSKK